MFLFPPCSWKVSLVKNWTRRVLNTLKKIRTITETILFLEKKRGTAKIRDKSKLIGEKSHTLAKCPERRILMQQHFSHRPCSEFCLEKWLKKRVRKPSFHFLNERWKRGSFSSFLLLIFEWIQLCEYYFKYWVDSVLVPLFFILCIILVLSFFIFLIRLVALYLF